MDLMKIDFMSRRFIAMISSGALLLVSIVSLSFMQLNWGLDFTGGVLVELGFEEAIELDKVREKLDEKGYENAVVQYLGSEREVVVRVPPLADVDQSTIGNQIHRDLEEVYGTIDLRKADFVGPAIGSELTEQGGLALLIALISVMIYIMFRFTGKFALGAVAALIHDVIIVLGIFSLMRWRFNLAELAALLAVIGYSLNDTIVVSDRIRENFRSTKRGTVIEIINRSLNQTLARTLVTSITTLLVLVALLVAAGEQLRGFATALSIGVVVGTYSSIFVTASSLVTLKVRSEDLELPEKEGQHAVS
ncbi:MAG: protein translocase subunit SecF [Gammaproteobacteria bacterium]|nr:protein translocase subunit SecF [Gammaproteobacteria bacterium]